METITLHAIGVIHTPFTRPEDTPIQGCLARESRGTVELDPAYAAGLQDIAGFSHLVLLYCFHRAAGYDLLAKPFLDKDKKGIFATRYFRRPNPLGLTVVRLLGVKENVLEVAEVDMLDGTPLLDIKPYVPRFDARAEARDGWFQTASEWPKYE
jgi:tRNA-Thr(GGU) m(6)t(6)A37 methyltransferase TsaA